MSEQTIALYLSYIITYKLYLYGHLHIRYKHNLMYIWRKSISSDVKTRRRDQHTLKEKKGITAKEA